MPDETNTSEADGVQLVHKALEPFTPAQRARILGAVFSLLEVSKIELPENYQLLLAGEQKPNVGDISQLSIDAFLRSTRPATTPQRLACLAYYLERHDEVVGMTAKDLRKANDDARQLTLEDISRDVSSAARREKFFRKIKEHTYQLTSLGIAAVEALPDQSRVKAIIEEQSNLKRKSGPRKTRG